MGGTDLKTDSTKRWMIYSKETYGIGRIFLSAEQKQAAEEGKKFAQRAYADVWAKDIALVQRVRSFLNSNFHWHHRLTKVGADLEVIQTLQSMIRGDSVVLVAEQSRTGGSVGTSSPKPQGLSSFRQSLMTSYGMTYDEASDYIKRYNAMIDQVQAVAASLASGVVSSFTDDASGEAGAATPLGDAQPFEYIPDALTDDVEALAASTNNPDYAAKMLGYDRKTFGYVLHEFKPANGLGPADNVIWHDNGDVYFNGNFVANFHDWAN